LDNILSYNYNISDYIFSVMKVNRLVSSICRSKWLIEPRTAMVERQRAVKFLNGDYAQAEEPEVDKPYAIKAGSYFEFSDDNQFDTAEVGSVAIISICGTIMKYDYCGSPGTDTLSSWLKSAIASPQIDAIVLCINSGGGSVEGTGEFADLIKSSTKTILAFCDGLMASAAYWIGCSAKEVWASHATCEFGSIGTAVCFMDDSKYLEDNGFKEMYFNADSSPDKNQDVIKAIEGDATQLKENIINPTNEIFMDTVKANRKLKLKTVTIGDEDFEEPLTGKVYLSKTAMSFGLIDGICTMDEVIERALELSEPPTPKQTEIINTQTRKHLKFQYNGN